MINVMFIYRLPGCHWLQGHIASETACACQTEWQEIELEAFLFYPELQRKSLCPLGVSEAKAISFWASALISTGRLSS